MLCYAEEAAEAHFVLLRLLLHLPILLIFILSSSQTRRIAHYAEKQSSNFCVVLSNPHQLFGGDYGGRRWGVDATELAPPIQVPQQSINLFLNFHYVHREAEARARSDLIFRCLSLCMPVQVSTDPAEATSERSRGPCEVFVATSKLLALTPGPSLLS